MPTATTLTFNTGGVYDLNSFNQTLVGTIGGSGTITDSGAPATLTINDLVSYTMGPVLTGALNLTKTGVGTLTLTQTDTYSGTTTINGGVLSIGARPKPRFRSGGHQRHRHPAGQQRGFSTTRGITLGGGSDGIDAVPGATLTLTGNISGTGSLLKGASAGGGTLLLSGTNNNYTGATTINNGTLQKRHQ